MPEPDVLVVLPDVLLDDRRHVVVPHVLVDYVHLIGEHIMSLVEVLDQGSHGPKNSSTEGLAERHRYDYKHVFVIFDRGD
jgi:hypothetical protein